MDLSKKKKPALLLSGGGIKAAAFHVGVCIALGECGFSFHSYKNKKGQDEKRFKDFEIYVGSSAGAVIATILACGFDAYDLIDAFLRGKEFETFKKKNQSTKKNNILKPISYTDIFGLNTEAASQFLSNLFHKQPVIRGGLEVLFKKKFKLNGIFSTKNIGRYLKEHVLKTNNFQDLNLDLSIIATRLDHSELTVFGKTEEAENQMGVSYKKHTTISDAVCASASLPPLFSPYGIENKLGHVEYYFDGEIRDTLPTFIPEKKGADLIIASSSIEPYEFNPEMGSLQKYGVPLIINQAIYQMIQQKISSDTQFRNQSKKVINDLEDLLRKTDLDKKIKEKIIDSVLENLSLSQGTDCIYIHPSSKDYQMFFYDHFSLNEKVLSHIVRIGFRSAMHALRPHLEPFEKNKVVHKKAPLKKEKTSL